MGKRVTSSDIARAAGVSRTLVSYILNDVSKVKIRDETRRRVQQVAKDLQYRPNQSARAIREGRFRSFSLLLGASYYLPRELLDGLYRVIAAHDIHLTVAPAIEPGPEGQQRLPKVLREHMTDGILINTLEEQPQALRDWIAHSPVPCVQINDAHPGNCVYPDDRDAARRATEELLKRGHRKIAYAELTGSRVHYSSRDREVGYRSAIFAAGLSPQIVAPEQRPEGPDRVRTAKALLESGPTAVVAYSWPSAAAVSMAAHELGQRIPDDLSLMTFENTPNDWLGPKMATFKTPWQVVAAQAVEMLQRRITDNSRDEPSIAVPYTEFVEGGTLGVRPL